MGQLSEAKFEKHSLYQIRELSYAHIARIRPRLSEKPKTRINKLLENPAQQFGGARHRILSNAALFGCDH
jgi:hypothetical protein